MPRRTKQDAQATRDLLLDTAELLFQQRGVSRTSLNEIACAAGVSRGAIYWHFQDKADLFNAMMNRISLPMEEALDRSVQVEADALVQLRCSLVDVLRKLATDPQVRRVFEIATQKVEYVDELSGIRSRHLQVRSNVLASLTTGLRQAAVQGRIAQTMAPSTAAIGLHALIDGLIQNWILDPGAFDLVSTGEQVLDAYLAGLAAASEAGPPASPSKRSRQCSRTP